MHLSAPQRAILIPTLPATTPMQSEVKDDASGADSRSATVMVVEDNEWVQNYVRKIFRNTYNVVVASDGVEALELLEDVSPDLIILDIMMPRMDGNEVFARLKARGDWQNIPVIMFSAMSDEEHKLEGLEAGADDYIAKPFNPRELRARAKNLIQLRQQERELSRLNASLEARVQTQVAMILAERRRYEKELVAARDKAEASDRLKGFILRNMSHEIRTPITNILGFAEILGERVSDEDLQFTQYIQGNGKRLLETVTAILDFSKLATDSFEIEPEAMDLREAVFDAIARYSDAANEKGLRLSCDVAANVADVRLDRPAFDRVLNHLIGNAIKFTREGGIIVRAGYTPDETIIEVEDTGVGISEEFRPDLFLPFKQESEGDARDFEGTGLGLAICGRLVELMGGQIEVESEKGIGTTFRINFPKVRGKRAASWARERGAAIAPDALPQAATRV